MVFSSVVFLAYFLPVLLLAYSLVPRPYRNWVLLVASIVFYSWGAPRFIFVILGTTFVDFYLVAAMSKAESRTRRRLFLTLSASINLGLLFYFKYCNFFIGNINALLGSVGVGEMKMLEVVLPIGISFYTFESLTYVVDVYRRVHAPLKNVWNYQLYILLFPKLIAGPIIRYHEIADQIPAPRADDIVDNKIHGFVRFCLGLAKKVFIANTVGSVADEIFGSDPNAISSATAWLGMLSYTFQIYFDFSGYSDMAIGLGKMFGFTFPENFNNPYTSRSITEFWRRWHMTLGNWMKNYLYIPLGGNKVSTGRMYLNLWLVFLASGLWHGAAWTFVFWGIFHGTFLVLERLFLQKIYARLGSFLPMCITFVLVMFGWVLFRADTLQHALLFFKRLLAFDGSTIPVSFDARALAMTVLAALFSFFVLLPGGARVQGEVYFGNYRTLPAFVLGTAAVCIFILALGNVAASSFNPFIYFRF